MDVLTDMLQTVRLRSHLYGRMELTAPWGMRIDTPHQAGFFVVSRGNCWLEVIGADNPVPLAGGDFVFLPKARCHILRDALDTAAAPIVEVIRGWEGPPHLLRYGGGGIPVSLVFGCFTFEDKGRNPLVESLPPMIHIRADSEPSVQWLETTLQFVASEAASSLPGAETVTNRLADILFVQAVRAHIAGGSCQVSGWLKALADPQIGQALRLIHDGPQQPWTVESLAKAVAMSRSAFAARFTALAGEAPFRYLTAWRMKKASHMLLRGDPIAAVAPAVGYDTDTAFGKAFKKYAGTTPGEFRRQARESEAQHPRRITS